MADWDEIAALATPGVDIPTIKEKLPIGYVLYVADIAVEQTSDGKLHALCPFHDDREPSLDVYWNDAGVQRWNCPPCGMDGDVIDLIHKLPNFECINMGDALKVARTLLSEVGETAWANFKAIPKEPFNVEAAMEIILDAQDPDSWGPLEALLEEKDYPFDAEWLNENFKVGSYETDAGIWAAVAPYYSSSGELVGYKHRAGADDKFISGGGSNFSGVFYNEGSDDGKKPILLCESETDVWVAQYKLGDKYTVLGLPTGAGSKPESRRQAEIKTRAERLAHRDVVVAFDGDGDALLGKKGRGANMRWYVSLTLQGCNVKVVPMPDDYDVASVPNLEELVANARTILAVPKTVRIDSAVGGYIRPGKEKNEELSNWYFEPDRELHGETGTAYEGIIQPSGKRTVITSADLKSRSALIAWSTLHESSFFGSDRDAQQILALLQHRGPFLATGKMTNVAGLHENQFVYPGGRIGADHWVYVPPSYDIGLEGKMKALLPYKDENWNPKQVVVMRRLHDSSVMDPLLSWLAVVPLRAKFNAFPIFSLTGSAGTGKTTIVETILPIMTGSLITTNLTDTTPHSLSSYCASTNGFPVWLEELRREIRRDTMDAVRQTFRDAYTGQSITKGGMDRNNFSLITELPRHAPIIVTGEDAFSETSHTERMILVNLPLEGRDPVILKQIQSWGKTGFAHYYLSWSQASLIAGTLPLLEVEPFGPEDLPPRVRYNLGMLKLGWEILIQFLYEHGIDADKAGMTEPNFDLIIDEAREAAESNPIRDAIIWAVQQSNAYQFAHWDHDAGIIYLRPDEMVYQIEKFSTYTLPGGVKAIEKFIRAHYGATRKTIDMGGQVKRVWEFTEEPFLEDEDD